MKGLLTFVIMVFITQSANDSERQIQSLVTPLNIPVILPSPPLEFHSSAWEVVTKPDKKASPHRNKYSAIKCPHCKKATRSFLSFMAFAQEK